MKNNIKIGNILSYHEFISGTKYYKIDSVLRNKDLFEAGSNVEWYDEDDNEFMSGKIEWIMFNENLEIEVSTDHPVYGRVDFSKITLIK